MSQISLIGAAGAVLYDGNLSDLSKPLAMPALVMNSDSSSYAIKLGQSEDPIFLAAGSRGELEARRRTPAAVDDEGDGPSQDRTLHLNITAGGDGEVSKVIASIKDRSFTSFQYAEVGARFTC